MKKYLLTILLLCTLLGGCASEAAVSAAAPAPAKTGVDLDMTNMGGTIAYSQAVDFRENPDYYLGKTIKVKGNYYPTYYDPTEQYYHLIIVGDEASCCREAIEFVWTGNHTFPDDYPVENAEIIIAGVYEKYDELGETYYHLVAEEITLSAPTPSENWKLTVQ